jgi:hypothetical protein
MHVQPSWENKLLFPPVIKAQRKEPPMNARLTALVKRVYELRAIGRKACHCIEEFHHWRIRLLVHWKRRAYECPRMVDPNREPTDGKLPTLSLQYWGQSWFDIFPFCAALSQEEIDGYVTRLFDKDPPTAWPADLPLPYSNKNPPPSIRVTIILIILQPIADIL